MTVTKNATLWIDADACPKAIRELIIRAAMRTQTHTYFVANHALALPKLAFIHTVSVPSGADAADNHIVEHAASGDVVITSDLPLASLVLAKGAQVLTTRGESLTRDNIGPRLNMRDFMETMRASGEHSRGAKPLHPRDVQAFANAFDRILARLR